MHLEPEEEEMSDDEIAWLWLQVNVADRHWDGTIGRACSWHLSSWARGSISQLRGPDLKTAILNHIRGQLRERLVRVIKSRVS